MGILPEVGRVSLGADEGVVVHLLDAEGRPTGKARAVARATFTPGVAPARHRRHLPCATACRWDASPRSRGRRPWRPASRRPSTSRRRWSARGRDATYAVRAGEFKDRERGPGPGGPAVPIRAAGRLRGRGSRRRRRVPPCACCETGEDLLGATVVPARDRGHPLGRCRAVSRVLRGAVGRRRAPSPS